MGSTRARSLVFADTQASGRESTLVQYRAGAGGFVGLGRHDVAIPASHLQVQDGKFVLPGATKDVIKSLPKFQYAKAK